ncbi:MAG: nuclear transport factor 2 family protein [Bacteroidota bacterium]
MKSLLPKEEWSIAQKKIWKNIETYTKFIMNGDTKKFLDYFHKDYSGWNYYEPLPVNKTDVINELQYFQKPEVVSYDIIPIAINIFNDVAIVHYYNSTHYKNAEGKEKIKQGRNTDILLKQKDKWILIGDYGGILKNKDINISLQLRPSI